MSNLLRAQSTLANRDSDSLGNVAGDTLLWSGAGALGLGALAFVLPVITLPMLAPVALGAGIYFKVKSKK